MPYFEKLESGTKEWNDQLYPLVALGDTEARQQMIQGNIGLAVMIANRYLAFMPEYRYFFDDLKAAGLVGLTEAVAKMADRGFVDGHNSTVMMCLQIQQNIGEALDREQAVRVPSRTKRDRKKKGLETNLIHRIDIADISHSEDDAGRPPNRHEQAFFAKTTCDPRRMQEIRQMLDDCCESDADREIIRLREQGCVDREIAEYLSLPLTTVYVMRRALYARFLELSGWKG